jgi:hypothetical protein
MSEAEQENSSLQQITIPLEWHVPDHISSRYADNVIVQPRKHDIIISFFESQPPLLGGTPEQNRAFLETLSSIRAECIGKIVVVPELLPDIIKALQRGYEGYLSAKDAKESTDA